MAGKNGIHAYAVGDEARCWKEDGGDVVVCQVRNGRAFGYDSNTRKYQISTKKTGLMRIYKNDGYAVHVAWG
jgi:hypothetical protein